MGGNADSDWDPYWKGSSAGQAYNENGISHPAIRAFWCKFFGGTVRKRQPLRVVDIASGNGSVLAFAREVHARHTVTYTAVDVSAAALEALEARFPGVHTVCADAREIPCEAASFDVATSQFGIEYAGLGAVPEMLRLLAPTASVALLLHHEKGLIRKEGAAALAAIRRIRDANFVSLSRRLFESGFAACRGADRAPYDEAAAKLQPAVQVLEEVLVDHGQDVAGGLLVQLYDGVATIHRDLQRYDPREVLGWLDKMQPEIDAFAGRMQAMHAAAIGERQFAELCETLRAQGFKMLHADTLDAEPSTPIAWTLVAQRS